MSWGVEVSLLDPPQQPCGVSPFFSLGSDAGELTAYVRSTAAVRGMASVPPWQVSVLPLGQQLLTQEPLASRTQEASTSSSPLSGALTWQKNKP